jgi:hypothetical protein
MSNSIFILKPIIDALYEDVKKDREVMDALKAKISVLEKENSELYAENRRLESRVDGMVEIDDAAYAAEASAPATCTTGSTCVVSKLPSEEENKVIEPVEPVEESLKTVKMVGTVSKKEYMKEYQKKYRKQRKDITLNL